MWRLLPAWLAVTAAVGAVTELQIDPLTTADRWRLGGRRINYVLGNSSVSASSEQHREGYPTTLRLAYDFSEPRRDYLSYYSTGPAIPGDCRRISFHLFGNESGCRLRLALEDARGRWFQREAGRIDWAGWRQVSVPVGSGEGWTALLRIGEEPLSVLQPVALREIAIVRGAPDQANGVVFVSDLRAECDLVPADLVTLETDTGRPANLFDHGDAPTIGLTFRNSADEAVEGRLAAVVTDFFGASRPWDLGELSLPAGGAAQRQLSCPTDREGVYEVAVVLAGAGRERRWHARFAVAAPWPPRPADSAALFGCCANVEGFTAAQMPTVWRLNRDAGLRWARLGFSWEQINPAPGRWAWDPPERVPGAIGQALLCRSPLEAPHDPRFDVGEAVTIACWAKVSGGNGAWQWPLSKLGAHEAERAYGVYFHRDSGRFVFTAGFARLPDTPHIDLGCGFSAWDDRWHHYAASYSAADRRVILYVDGEVAATHSCDGGPLRANAGSLQVGQALPGALDEVLLYNRALSGEEVRRLAGREPAPREGLVAGWSFEGTGAEVADVSGHGLILAAPEPSSVRLARAAREHGILTLGLLGFPPRWASTAPPEAARPWVYKPDLDAWAEFVERTTRQYADLVEHWELWNEPNISVFWEPRPDAGEYAEVVRVGYAAAKRGNPRCTVIAPGLAGPTGGPDSFLDALLGLGLPHWCDAISIHPYRQATPEDSDLVGDLEHIVRLAEANGGRRRLWWTENCWTTHLPGGSTERRQALMLARAYALGLGSDQMERFIWFRLHDNGPDRFYTEYNYGLCYPDLTPKPAWFAHRTTAMLLEGARPEEHWQVGAGALARCFRTPTERVAAIWASEGPVPVAIRAASPAVRLVDLMGNETRRPTEEGVLLLNADETVVFLRGLEAAAEGCEPPLALFPATVERGGRGTLRLRLSNPFPTPRQARLALATTGDLQLVRDSEQFRLDAGQAQDVEIPFAASAAATPGWRAVAATLDLGGHRLSLSGRVAVRAAPPDAGPVGYWPLDEGEGATFADRSGHGNHGSVTNPQWVEGKRGKALAFDGSEIAVVPDSPSLNLPDEVTVAFWLKVTGTHGSWQFPVTKYLRENVRRNYGIYLRIDDLAPAFSASFERGAYRHDDFGSGKALDLNRWYHIAASYSMFDERVSLYLDGTLVATRPAPYGAMLLTTDPLRIGVATVGVIDEVRVYPRALSPTEVAQLAR